MLLTWGQGLKSGRTNWTWPAPPPPRLPGGGSRGSSGSCRPPMPPPPPAATNIWLSGLWDTWYSCSLHCFTGKDQNSNILFSMILKLRQLNLKLSLDLYVSECLCSSNQPRRHSLSGILTAASSCRIVCSRCQGVGWGVFVRIVFVSPISLSSLRGVYWGVGVICVKRSQNELFLSRNWI